MPEIDINKFYQLTTDQWRKYAMFHAQAADIMRKIATALQLEDREAYHDAVGEFANLAEAQSGGPLVVEA